MKRTYKLMIAITVLLFIVLAAFALLGRSHVSSVASPQPTNDVHDELQAELQKIRAAGQPLTVEEMLSDELPDSKNAAILYQEAFNKLSLSEANRKTLMDLFTAMSRSPKREAPSTTTLVAIVAANVETIELLEASARLSECRFPVDWSAGMEVGFPAHHGKLQQCARLLGAKAVLHSRRGEIGQVLDTVRLGLALGEAAGSDPVMLGQLARYGLHSTILRALQSSACDQVVPTKACKELFEYLRKLEFTDSFVQALWGERAMGIRGLDSARQDTQAAEHTQDWDFDRDEVAYLRLMSEWIADAAEPRRGASDVTEEYEARVAQLPEYCGMSRILLPVLSLAPRKRDETIARVGLAQTTLALKAYKNGQANYPESVGELRQIIPWELREDPFSGEDFVYRADGDGFLLYSVGPNLTDDGGQPFGAKPGADDIVWRCVK